MNADPLTYAPFLLLLLLGALVEIRYWIRNRARMTPKARLRRGLFLAALLVISPPHLLKKGVLRLPSGTPFIYLKSF